MNGKATSVWLTGYVGRCSGAYPVYTVLLSVIVLQVGVSNGAQLCLARHRLSITIQDFDFIAWITLAEALIFPLSDSPVITGCSFESVILRKAFFITTNITSASHKPDIKAFNIPNPLFYILYF